MYTRTSRNRASAYKRDLSSDDVKQPFGPWTSTQAYHVQESTAEEGRGSRGHPVARRHGTGVTKRRVQRPSRRAFPWHRPVPGAQTLPSLTMTLFFFKRAGWVIR